MKYKVGQKVTVRKDLSVTKLPDGLCVVHEMLELRGKEAEITYAHEYPDGDRYHVLGSEWWWSNDCFEEPKRREVIVITSDGVTTTARLKDGKTTVKEDVSKCADSDTFDQYEGARIALARLFGKDPFQQLDGPVYREVDRYAKVGEFVRCKSDDRFNGDVCEVIALSRNGDGHIYVRTSTANDSYDGDCSDRSIEHPFTYLDVSQYAVLEGHPAQKEPEPPKYFNGKAVCIKSFSRWFTVGKVYTFKDGRSLDDNGDVFPFSHPAADIESMNGIMCSQFIEFKGEA